MSKDPAFLFYSQDFIVGVQTLSFEDRGKYITILAQMHQQGRMDEETISFLVGSVSVKLKAKFQIDENGLWYNERLEQEIEKRANFVETRRLNGMKGGRGKKSDKPLGKPNGKPNGVPNENENEIENGINAFKENFEKTENFTRCKMNAGRAGIKGEKFKTVFDAWAAYYMNKYDNYLDKSFFQLESSLTQWISRQHEFEPSKKKSINPALIA